MKIDYQTTRRLANVYETQTKVPRKILGKSHEISASNVKPFLSYTQKTTLCPPGQIG